MGDNKAGKGMITPPVYDSIERVTNQPYAMTWQDGKVGLYSFFRAERCFLVCTDELLRTDCIAINFVVARKEKYYTILTCGGRQITGWWDTIVVKGNAVNNVERMAGREGIQAQCVVRRYLSVAPAHRLQMAK